MTRRTLIFASTVAAAFALGLTVDHLAFAAQQQPAIKRTILQRQDDPGSPSSGERGVFLDLSRVSCRVRAGKRDPAVAGKRAERGMRRRDFVQRESVR